MLLTLASALVMASAMPGQVAAWTRLADGTYMQSGSISSTYRWQSSGELFNGGCSSSFGIKNCYTMRLGGYNTNLQNTTAGGTNPDLTRRNLNLAEARIAPVSPYEALAAEDDEQLDAYYTAFPDSFAEEQQYGLLEKRQVVSNCTGPPPDPTQPPPPPAAPRQRIEFLSWPGAAAGHTWTYRWKSRTQATYTGSQLHHHWQILRRDACGGVVVSLSFNNGRALIKDTIQACPRAGCPSVALTTSWFGRTIIHTLTVKYGLSGSIDYTAVDQADPSTPLIRYVRKGDMGANASLKHGIYRTSTPETQAISAFHGEYSATRVS